MALRSLPFSLPMHYRIRWDDDLLGEPSIPLSGNFRVEKIVGDQTMTLRLLGHIDTPSTYLLQDMAFFEINLWHRNGHPLRMVTVDFRGVEGLDSAAVGVLLLIKRRLSPGVLNLVHLPPGIRSALHRAGAHWLVGDSLMVDT